MGLYRFNTLNPCSFITSYSWAVVPDNGDAIWFDTGWWCDYEVQRGIWGW
jgi:hypothetical protein